MTADQMEMTISGIKSETVIDTIRNAGYINWTENKLEQIEIGIRGRLDE